MGPSSLLLFSEVSFNGDTKKPRQRTLGHWSFLFFFCWKIENSLDLGTLRERRKLHLRGQQPHMLLQRFFQMLQAHA